uniref:regulator of G-protein signaling protein-like n=1 Tax=Centroberyx gerrardi TaxID=166262 RepID=UPI003AAAF4D0
MSYIPEMAPRLGGKCNKTLADFFADDVFVDFFNTFMNLPVFGQTPLYVQSENRWYLCPEIPGGKSASETGFYQWMRYHRFLYFKQSELYNCYILCKDLLGSPTCQTKEVLKSTLADQWLLKRCLGTVRGMRRFCSFVKGTNGEELVTFCVRVDRLLHIDWSKNVSQRNRYESLFTVIRTIHLSDGSNIMRTCRLTSGRLVELAGSHPDEMKEQMLAQMRSKALSRLQSYWLPQYLRVCKAAVTSLDECSSIAKEYEDVASGFTPQQTHKPCDPSSWHLNFESSNGRTVIQTYCSKMRKRVLFRSHQRPGTGVRVGAAGKHDGPGLWKWLPFEEEGGKRGCNNIVHIRSRCKEEIIDSGNIKASSELSGNKRMKSNKAKRNTPFLPPIIKSKILPSLEEDTEITPHVCMQTPICHFPSIITTNPLPPPPPHLSPKPASVPPYDEHLSLGLSADALAGAPYEDFLRAQGQNTMLHHLGLWQELDNFLNLLLKTEDGPSKALRQVLAKKIVTVYLSVVVSHQRQKCTATLCKDTTAHLISLLPSGNVMPWIHTAKQELCQILAPTYYAFLDEEDKCFLTYLFSLSEMKGKVSCGSTAPPDGPRAPELQVKRMREAVALCQAYCGYTDAGPLTEETWALLPLEDVRRGGSVHLYYRKTNLCDLPFATLALKYPKVAVEEVSKTLQLCSARCGLQQEEQVVKTPEETQKEKKFFVPQSSMRPRNFKDVLKNTTSQDYFASYLRQFNAHRAMKFYQVVEKLRNVNNIGRQWAKINNIVNRFFKHRDAVECLQCNAPIISKIPKMTHVTADVLYSAQEMVAKSLEISWFSRYQDTFPVNDEVAHPLKRLVVLNEKLKHAWGVLTGFIRSVCMFRKAIRNSDTKRKFEAYLKNHWTHFSTRYIPTPENKQMEVVGLYADDGNFSHLKRRVVNNKAITVDFLVNDLSFYLETESYRNVADSDNTMASAGLFVENNQVLLHQKAEMIINLFFNSEMAPQLRINISKRTSESIRQSFSVGKVDGGLFSDAVVAVFPNLIYCWKR